MLTAEVHRTREEKEQRYRAAERSEELIGQLFELGAFERTSNYCQFRWNLIYSECHVSMQFAAHPPIS
jgi:hypothetical protein